MSISEDKLLPSWVLNLSPMDEIEKAKSGQVTKPRMWMCRGLSLISPKLEDGVLSAGMVITEDNHPSGEVEVFDIDSGDSFVIRVPENIEDAYLLDVCWS